MLGHKLSKKWQSGLSKYYDLRLLDSTMQKVQQQRAKGKLIYPDQENLLKVFSMLEPDQVKVVILGQDPYHQPGQAQGYSFSVPSGVKLPPSLKNIYKELEADLSVSSPPTGDLEPWVKQGVFLLNSVLSVEESKPGSHKNFGWGEFSDAVLKYLSAEHNNIVFVMWGGFAIKKQQFIDEHKHLVLTSPHPSPLSSYRGFFGSKPFSQINNFLSAKNLPSIDWVK